MGERNFLETQGPKDLQNRSQRGQWTGFGIARIATCQPMSEVGEGVAQEGSCRLGDVQAVGPPAERGGIGDAIWVFERGRRLFPGAVLLKAPPQCATASQQAVVRVRERKRRQEGEGLPATGAATAPDPDPVVMLVVRLLAAASMADDRIALTLGTSPQDDLVAGFGPIGFELVQRGRRWDKENRSSLGLCRAWTCQDLSQKRSPSSCKRKSQLEENNASQLQLFVVGFRRLAG